MGIPTVFPKLRGGEVTAEQARALDNVDAVLRPMAQALSKTPIMGAPPPGWVRPALLADFVNLGGGFATVGYAKDALGYVWLKGLLSTPAGQAAGTHVMTLDPGYRPSESVVFPCYGNAATAQFISIDPGGAVFSQVIIAAAGTIGFYVSFLAEQ